MLNRLPKIRSGFVVALVGSKKVYIHPWEPSAAPAEKIAFERAKICRRANPSTMREPRSGHPAEPLSRPDSSLGVSLSRLTRYHQTTWSCPIWGLNASACSNDCCARVGARQKPAREASTRSRLGSGGKPAPEPITVGNRPFEEREVFGAAHFFVSSKEAEGRGFELRAYLAPTALSCGPALGSPRKKTRTPACGTATAECVP